MCTVGVLAGSLVACGESSPAEIPETNFEAAEVFDIGASERIDPGQSIILTPHTNSGDIAEIRDRISIIDHQYPHGLEDEEAAVVSADTPIRIDAHIALHGGESDYTDNDLSCDTVKLDFTGITKEAAYILGVALSEESDDRALVNWPQNPDGSIREWAQICFSEGHEPSDGVVLALSDQPR